MRLPLLAYVIPYIYSLAACLAAISKVNVDGDKEHHVSAPHPGAQSTTALGSTN